MGKFQELQTSAYLRVVHALAAVARPRRKSDHGAGFAEYSAVIILVAAIATGLMSFNKDIAEAIKNVIIDAINKVGNVDPNGGFWENFPGGDNGDGG